MNFKKNIIFSIAALFFCILLCKRADAAVVFEMNSNTSINDAITAVDGSSGAKVTVGNMISVVNGQKFNLSQVSDLEEIIQAGVIVSVENMKDLKSFSYNRRYNADAVTIDNNSYEISVRGEGIAVIKIVTVINSKSETVYFAVNGIDGNNDIYNTIENIDITGIETSGSINSTEDALKLYNDYYDVYELANQSDSFDEDINIQHDRTENAWKITNGDKYLKAYSLLSDYFDTKRLLLSKIKFVSEYEGIVLIFDHEVTTDDMLSYAFFGGKKFDEDAGITLNAAISNQTGELLKMKQFTIYKGQAEVKLELDDELKTKGKYSVEVSGTGHYTSSADYIFEVIFKVINKGAFVKKKTVVYSGIYNGEKICSISAKSRYHCIGRTSDGWLRIELSDGTVGYILKGNISLSANDIANIVNIYDKKYSYADLSRDIKKMAKYYQDVIELSVLTVTADNNNVYCVRLGNEDADRKIIIQSTMHAREWLNSQLIMKMLERCCKSYYSAKYDNVLYSELFDNVCFYIIPMLNPDGVNISQYGLGRIKSSSLKKLVKRLGKGNYSRWKANARGVDLNRNCGVGFRQNNAKGTKRGPANYSGPFAYSEKETKALVNLVNKIKPNAVINYHEAGRVIYYQRGSKLNKVIHEKTRYKYVREDSKANGSFGDLLARKGITWSTVETCSGSAPVSHTQFYYEWVKHRNIIQAVAKLYSN